MASSTIQLSDWIGLYAALLSTALALVGAVRWLLAGPKLAVTVFNPLETSMGGNSSFLCIVTNSGSTPTVVQSLDVSFRTARWFWGKEIGKAEFNEGSNWKPSVKLVPVENKVNTFREEPNVIQPGEEIRAPARAVQEYDPHTHWIRVAATPRNCRWKFVGWAAPSRMNLSDSSTNIEGGSNV
ncbi:hypothetical protein ACKTEK_00685 [Tepidamorphus sp. 3E244]|uniref:hypothetical protein n=1 Tax=Tepidamorphus sp. 3E244 TaxID=3385498 RepID=UPI0038FD0CF9